MTQYSSPLRGLAVDSAFLFPFTPTVFAAEQTVETPSVDARAWILMGYASGEVLVEGNTGERLDPASLTKIMTSCVAGQALKADKVKPIDMMTVDKGIWATGNSILRGSSVMFLKPGNQVSVADSGKGVIIRSGNDACIALADYVVGSQELSIGLMNNYVEKLGLTDTTFQMMHGLGASGQFSTAHNMALLGKALIHDVPEEYAIHKGKESTLNKIRQLNRSRLLRSSNLSVGSMKAGITAGAGYNLVASATQGDTRLTSVALGAKTDRIHFNEPEKLLTWGFHSFKIVTPIKPDATFMTWRVWFDDKSEVDLRAGEAGSVTMLCGQLKNLKASYTLTEPQFAAPLKKGQVIGIVDSQLNGKPIE